MLTIPPESSGGRANAEYRLRAFLAFLVLFLPPAWAEQAQQPAMLRINEPAVVTEALRAPDDAAIRRMKQRAQDGHQGLQRLVAAADARIRGDLATSSREANACYEASLHDIKQVADVGAACRELAAGNQYILGNHREWATIARDLADYLEEKVARSVYPGAEIRIANYAGIDFEAIARHPQKTSVKTPGTPVRIARVLPEPQRPGDPVRYDAAGDTHPFMIAASINGSDSRFYVDTGAVTTVVNRAQAERLKLPIVTRDYLPLGNAGAGIAVASSLATIDRLQIGAIVVEKALVAVADSPTVLGLDLLSRFKSVRFTETDLMFDPAAPASCTRKMRLKSNWLGDYGLLANLEMNKAPVYVLLDTGDSAGITATRSAWPDIGNAVRHLKRAEVAGGVVEREIFVVDVEAAGRPAKLQVLADDSAPYAYLVGSGALKHLDLTIDFAAKTACFEARRTPGRSG